jgi:hypothetical protein
MIRPVCALPVLGAVLILMACPLYAQAPDSLWHRAYGDSLSDFGNWVIETAEGYYVTVGSIQKYDPESDKYHSDVLVVKTDANGDTAWVRTYGGTGTDSGRSVVQNDLGQYVVAGYTNSFGGGSWDVYLLVLEQNGDTAWTRTYGLGEPDEIAYCICHAPDGGYLMAGEFDLAGDEDVYLLRVDAAGDTLWTRTYGTTTYELAMECHDLFYGGFIAVGTKYNSSMDVYLLRLDDNGDTLWTRSYDFGLNDYGASVKPLSYWGYIVAGYSQSPDALDNNVLLMQVLQAGGLNWSRRYGGRGSDTGSSVQVVSTGGFVIGGSTNSFGAGSDDLYLIRTDANGDTLWTTTYGGAMSDWWCKVSETSDGGYILAGHTSSFGAGSLDMYVVKTRSDVSGLNWDPRGAAPSMIMRTAPNPAAASVAVYYALPTAGNVRVAVYDALGREVCLLREARETPGTHSVVWDGTDSLGRKARPGVYFCRVECEGKSAAAKIAVIE